MNPENYSNLSDDVRLNATLGPMVERTLELQQNSVSIRALSPIAEEVMFYLVSYKSYNRFQVLGVETQGGSDVGDISSVGTMDLGFMMVLSNDSIGAPTLCYAVSFT